MKTTTIRSNHNLKGNKGRKRLLAFLILVAMLIPLVLGSTFANAEENGGTPDTVPAGAQTDPPEGGSEPGAAQERFTISFVNWDGTVLQSGELDAGATPEFTGEIPTRAADEQYTYTFAGWDSQIAAVTGPAVYTAIYSSTVNQYAVSFADEDGTTIASAAYDYGTEAASIVKPADPTKEADEQYTYEFTGWAPEIANVTLNAVYTAT